MCHETHIGLEALWMSLNDTSCTEWKKALIQFIWGEISYIKVWEISGGTSSEKSKRSGGDLDVIFQF